jgi:hypothetical protein
MALPTIFWFREVRDFVAKIVPFVASALAFIAWAYNIVAVMIVAAINAIYDGIASLDTSFVSGGNFGGLEWIGYVNAVIPLDAWLALMSALMVFKIAIVTLRWIKSFIPTMAN